MPSSDPAGDFPVLLQLLGGYLHQGFDLDRATAADAVESAVVDLNRDQRTTAAAEIGGLLEDHPDEPSLAAALNRICSYHPPGDGLSYREWLGQLRARLERVG